MGWRLSIVRQHFSGCPETSSGLTRASIDTAAPVEDEGVEFMATAAASASGSLALGATDASCTGCAGKFVQTQVKTSTAFPYAAIGARLWRSLT